MILKCFLMIVLYWCNKNVTFEYFLRQTIGIPEIIRSSEQSPESNYDDNFRYDPLANLKEPNMMSIWPITKIFSTSYKNYSYFTILSTSFAIFAGGKLLKFWRWVNFHSKCKILGGVTEFFGKAFLCRFPPGNLPRPVVYPVHSLPIQVTLGDSWKVGLLREILP